MMETTMLPIRLSALLFLTTVASAQDAPPFGTPELLRFDNGLQVVLQAAPSGTTVSAATRIQGGWGEDPSDAHGVAHLVEHLWYRSQAGATDTWTDYLQRGCITTATTSAESTDYRTTCPADHTTPLVDGLIRRLRDPLTGVDEATVAVEVSVVEQEYRGSQTTGREVLQRLYSRLLPPEHRVHRDLTNPDLNAPALNLTQAQQFAKANYIPSNTVIALAGAFDENAVREQLTAAFGAPVATTPTASTNDRDSFAPAPHQPGIETLTQPVQLPRVELAWNLPPVLGGSYAMSMAAGHLGDALDSALNDNEAVVGAGCAVSDHRAAPALGCTITLAANYEFDDDIDSLIREGLADAWNKEGKKSLHRAYMRVRAEAPQDLLFSYTSPARRAQAHVSAVAQGSAPQTVNARIEEMRGWKPRGFETLGKRLFTLGRAARLHIVPGPATEKPRPPARRPAAQVAAPAAPVDAPPAILQEPRLAHRTLPSGLTVIAIQKPDSPYVMTSVRVPGGDGTQPAGLALVARSLTRGPGIQEAEGIRTGGRMGRGFVEIYNVAPASDLTVSVNAALLEARLRRPIVDADRSDDDALNRYIRRRSESLKAYLASPHGIAWAARTQAVTPDHSGSQGLTLDDLEAARKMDGTALFAWLLRTWQPTHGVVLVSGPQSTEEILEVATPIFSDWKVPQGIPPGPYRWIAPAEAPTRLTAVVDDPSSGVADIQWQCRLPDNTPQPVQDLISDMVDRRMWTVLRHERGLTYTPHAYVSSWPDGTTVLSVLVQTVPEQSGQTLTLVTATLDGLARDASPHLPAAQDRATRRLALSLASLEGVENLIVGAHREGAELTSPIAWHRHRLNKVPASNIEEALKPCLQTPAWTIVGPAGPVVTSLAIAGQSMTVLGAP